jgi:DNA polymerase-1
MISSQVEELITEKDLLDIYKQIDAPLFKVLSEMEREGILINKNFFSDLKNDFESRLNKIEQDIFTASGSEINLKSPKQVGELLFEKLNLPVIKKTKTGFSTDSEVLVKLKEFSDIPALILEFRELEKLLSTYVKVIPEIVWRDGRVHSHFNLNIAATGRLSSVNPNLQNIPVRSTNGKLIRKGFVAKPGHLLMSCDYSQVELRLLAHFSEDEVMIQAFKENKDIHAQTAAEVENIPLEKVSTEQRARAKAVNFGLMYGQSAFGLASALGISRSEAKDYINFYFERFGKVKGYLDSLKEFARQHGYVETMHGRKRFIPDINSQNRTVKAMAERVAINSPVQGSAADIIKLAMINISKRLADQNLLSKMLLQVHDELIFEVPDTELSKMKELVRQEMESVVELKVPLKVDMGIGVNWFDVK